MVLYGHTPVPAPEWVNNTLCLDTGCVFGGSLTALSYPERVLVSVPSARVYYEPARPFPPVAPGCRGHRGRRSAGCTGPAARASRHCPGRGATGAVVLDITDVTGTRVIETGYVPRIKVGAANAAAALEVMSRFAIDPRWLLYLPPTMSPVATAPDGDLLEHPAQAFAAYADAGVRRGRVRGEAHGVARRRAGVPVGGRRGGPLRRHPRHGVRRGVDADRAAVLRRRAHRGAA